MGDRLHRLHRRLGLGLRIAAKDGILYAGGDSTNNSEIEVSLEEGFKQSTSEDNVRESR